MSEGGERQEDKSNGREQIAGGHYYLLAGRFRSTSGELTGDYTTIAAREGEACLALSGPRAPRIRISSKENL